VRAGSATGTVLGSATVPVTGGWETFTTVSGSLASPPAGTTTLYLTFAGGTGALFDLDSFTVAAATEAESWTSQLGISNVAKAAASGGFTVGNIHNGDWTAYSVINTNGATRFSARVSSNGAGGTIQIRSGSATGTLLGSVTVPVTGGWETFTTVSTTLTGNASGALHLVYVGAGTAALFDVDSFSLSTANTGPIVGLASKCVDVSNGATADGTKIQLYTCNGTASQAWTRNGQTWRALGKCLDISGGGTADGTLVQLWTCNGTAAQNWVPGANSSLVNPNSGKCLDVHGNNSANGTQIHLWTCTGAANQAWSLP
jgi:hypothetical protein